MLSVFSHEHFMKLALHQAQQAFDNGEIPVGAVIVHNNTVVAKAHNMTEKLNDFTAHAEMLAFTSASEYFGSKYLNECTLYVTLEPCVMCAGASFWTRIGKVIYGASDDKRGYKQHQSLLHPKTEVIEGVMASESKELLHTFFSKRR